jgi:hypothetical protein
MEVIHDETLLDLNPIPTQLQAYANTCKSPFNPCRAAVLSPAAEPTAVLWAHIAC